VVVVLAGGGAKGFAHLAVLRRLERDRIPIARIVGTSMGAVVGGLYASGLSIEEIERVVGSLDPAKVALDQIDRQDLPQRARAYQRQYPIELEFGVRNGALSFARGVSDGQRFLALLQQLTSHVPADVSFNDLPIPFRAVATRYRDGEQKVFDRGTLHLAVRASMAAPAVFAPVEIDGETYVDGGLVANLPVEVALQEGADVLVVSYLAQDPAATQSDDPANALTVANRMLDILIRQNEKRNLALLRPQDILIQPQLKDVGFADFNRASEIVARAEQAVVAQDMRWQTLARQAALPAHSTPRLAFDQREKRIVSVRVSGTQHVPERFIEHSMATLVGQEFRAEDTARRIDGLYTSGYFETVHYALEHVRDEQYQLVVHVREKPYAPHFMKTSLGFSSELGGVNQFSVGVGYRRPWLNAAGLELGLDARVGTQSELAARLYQPLGPHWGVDAALGYERNVLPLYASTDLVNVSQDQKLGYMRLGRTQLGVNLVARLERQATLKLGLIERNSLYAMDTPSRVIVAQSGGQDLPLTLTDRHVSATGWRLQFEADQLDSANFPSRGYFLSGSIEQGLTGADYRSARMSARWALPLQAHTLNLGVNLGREDLGAVCLQCVTPTSLYLGGFQLMGAYRMGQLSGDRLAHVYGTYMYRLFDGGLFKQKTHVGALLEAGDAWFAGQTHSTKYSTSVFIALDSKIGDIYLGAARGSAGASNLFLQLGRRFSF
jgi:NTE family protein